MQVHPNGIRHIREDGRINEWKTPGKKTIATVGSNRPQVVIALSGGELIYFEMDMTGQLMEVEKHEMPGMWSAWTLHLFLKGSRGLVSLQFAPMTTLSAFCRWILTIVCRF
ncbi:uncharacterized protein A4U43_C05F35840 [Asparagus officinalis]|uniref:RSE1/DDB1/CPSF1 second beta-propeller domain-containing protein n=1 Tax=Asparagus officinalis TaxID=4686 RepID=A0A5P1F2I4_ASPOF|nr:uncharacterized protein A4U43_C05F35840 [Asparagus officinalis]